jgi:hypothetical protein
LIYAPIPVLSTTAPGGIRLSKYCEQTMNDVSH